MPNTVDSWQITSGNLTPGMKTGVPEGGFGDSRMYA
jgi:hypothetical protein